jgi:hypothetical protein
MVSHESSVSDRNNVDLRASMYCFKEAEDNPSCNIASESGEEGKRETYMRGHAQRTSTSLNKFKFEVEHTTSRDRVTVYLIITTCY